MGDSLVVHVLGAPLSLRHRSRYPWGVAVPGALPLPGYYRKQRPVRLLLDVAIMLELLTSRAPTLTHGHHGHSQLLVFDIAAGTVRVEGLDLADPGAWRVV